MNVTTNRTVLGAMLLSVLGCHGCTSLKPIEYEASKSVAAQVEPGQRLRVIDVYGERLDFKVTGVDDEYIEGRTADGTDVRIDASQVRDIKRRVRSPSKTTALVGGLTVFYVLGAIAAAYGAILAF